MDPIQLTPEQQRALDNPEGIPPRLLDPRTDTAYILVPEVVFVLGAGRDREHALELVARWRQPRAADEAWERLGRFWDNRLTSN